MVVVTQDPAVVWVERFDADSASSYYVNTSTQETQWDRPEVGRIIAEAEYMKGMKTRGYSRV